MEKNVELYSNKQQKFYIQLKWKKMCRWKKSDVSCETISVSEGVGYSYIVKKG